MLSKGRTGTLQNLSLRNASRARTLSAAVISLGCAEAIAIGIGAKCSADIVQSMIVAGAIQLLMPPLWFSILACVGLCTVVASEVPRWQTVGLASGLYIAFSALLFGISIPVISMIVFIFTGLVLAMTTAIIVRGLPWGLAVIAAGVQIFACFRIAWWAATLLHAWCGPAF
jgi:hypothetical protein